MDYKTILITVALVIVALIVLKKTGIDAKIGLSSSYEDFESDPTI